MKGSNKQKSIKTVVMSIILIMFMTTAFSLFGNFRFDDLSDNYVSSMFTAGWLKDDSLRRSPWGLRSLVPSGSSDQTYNPYLIDSPTADYEATEIRTQQLGVQGWSYYCAGYALSGTGGNCSDAYIVMQILNAAIFSLVIVLISINLSKLYCPLFGISFYVITAISHWMADFSLSSYWCLYLWFLPMLLSLICMNHLDKRTIFAILIMISMSVKCACGYEYISTIMCSSVIFPFAEMIASLKNKDKARAAKLFTTCMLIGIACLSGFIITLLIHGYLMSKNDILNGIRTIYEDEILRRTHGDPDMFGPEKASLQESTLNVVFMYNYTDVGFATLILNLISVFLLYKNRKSQNLTRHISLIVISLIGTVSWFVLAKGHSAVHLHLNPSLFMIGTLQIAFYVTIANLINLIKTHLPLLDSPKAQLIFNEKDHD